MNDRLVEILVNGKPKEVEKGIVSFDTIVTLAFADYAQHPERTYSVTYKKGHGEKPEGILSPGSNVKVKNGMQFKVKHTGQS